MPLRFAHDGDPGSAQVFDRVTGLHAVAGVSVVTGLLDRERRERQGARGEGGQAVVPPHFADGLGAGVQMALFDVVGKASGGPPVTD